jgi:hypothetical protein
MTIATALTREVVEHWHAQSDNGRDQRKAYPAEGDFAGEPGYANAGVKRSPRDGPVINANLTTARVDRPVARQTVPVITVAMATGRTRTVSAAIGRLSQ